jgi:hypothetical protein
MARANALLIVPPERPNIAAGEWLRALPLGDAALAAANFAL